MPLYELTQNNYYSFNIGEIHIISLNVAGIDNSIFDWLDNDLSRFKRFNKWTLALINAPVFLEKEGLSSGEIDFFHRLQDKFNFFKVDLVITSGGSHYQRTMPFNLGHIFEFKSEEENGTLKQCHYPGECEANLMIDPQAPIYVIDSFDNKNPMKQSCGPFSFFMINKTFYFKERIVIWL